MNPTYYYWKDVRHTPGQTGLHSTMYRGEGLRVMAEEFNRDPKGLAIKIWHQPTLQGVESYIWGLPYNPDEPTSSNWLEALSIQNICAHYGIAPRVYGIGCWKNPHKERSGATYYHPVALVEDVGDEIVTRHEAKQAFEAVRDLGRRLGFTIPDCTPTPEYNVRANKWIDFGGARFSEGYEDQMLDRYDKLTSFGAHAYQSPVTGPGADTPSIRNTMGRLEWLDLNVGALDFAVNSVLDVGCSGGQFLNYYNRTCKARGLGLELPEKVKGAMEYSAYTYNWNVDYRGVDLRSFDKPQERYDLVLFLSVEQYIGGLVEWVKDCVGHRLVAELHHEYGHPKVREWLQPDFEEVKAFWSKDYGRLVVHYDRVKG